MLETNDQIKQRLEKLKNLKEDKKNPYGKKFSTNQYSIDVKKSFEINEDKTIEVKLAGRIITLRNMGKAAFATIQDTKGTIQIYVQRDFMGTEEYQYFKKLDIGDIIGVEGILFKTQKGEITVRDVKYTLLSKSLRPLPEKFHGLQNQEQRYRQRYLDLISNHDSRNILIKRSKIISSIRHFLENQGYMEVETPMMHSIAGGASARPFVTHYNALNQKMYMRIATELYLKQLLVGGLDKIFEINRNFRNEGLSKQHNPEFTALELYQAYGDCRSMMELIETLIRHCAKEINGNYKVTHKDNLIIDFEPPFRQISYHQLIKEEICLDWFEISQEKRIAKAKEIGCHVDSSWGELELTKEVYEKIIEPTLIKPTFVTRLPKEFVPLAKKCTDDETLVDVYELVIDGKEISPGYSELNDPIDQRQRLEEQQERSKGTEEEQSSVIDETFLNALEHGMPPAGGLGLGIDRLVMLLTGCDTIRDVILFPQLKNQN